MKSFREFLSEDAVKVQKAWQDFMKANPQDFAKGGRFYDRGGTTKSSQAAKDFMKSYMKTGQPPEWAKFNQDVERAKSSPTKQAATQPPKTSTQPSPEAAKPPKGTQTRTQAPPKKPSTSTPPPPKPPTSSGLAPVSKPPTTTPKGPGLRSRLGKVAGPAVAAGGAALDYQARREAGQSKARAAGGAASQLAGYAAAAKFGAMVPGPPIVKGAAAIGAGIIGAEKAGQAYDYAADKTRPARQAISKATGFDKFQQKNELIKGAKPGQGLQSLARAQQTADTRSARAASSAYGTKKGSALTGIGGKTFVSKDKKGAAFMSTGAGSQRKTVELAKTQLVRDPKTGKQVVGDLAFKGGKATYLARPSVSSRDTSLSARVGRALNIGRFSKEAEAQAAKQEYRTALKNTQTYQKKLGITPKAAAAQKLPGAGVGPKKVGPKLVGPKLVGPKLVGPKIVGPKKVGPAKPQYTPGSSVRPV